MNARRNLKTKAILAVLGVALIASGIAFAAGMVLNAGKLGIFASGTTIATPTVGVSFPVAGNSYNVTGFETGCPTAGFCGTASAVSPDTASNVKVAIRRGTGNYWDGTSFTSATPVLLTATGTTSWSYGFTAANFTADDAYTVTAVATTSAGSTVSTNTTFTIDRVAPPAPSITSAPSTPTTDTGATFSFSDTEGGVAFECKLDAGSFASCTSSKIYSGLADGSHTFRVRALDGAGNASAEATHTWVVDTTPPSTVLTFPALSAYNTSTWNSGCSSAICGTASDASSGIAEVTVSIRQSSGSYWNGTSFGSDTEMFFTATGTTSWSFAFPASNFPGEGPYTVRAKSTDATGHESSVTSKTTSLDNTAPSAADIQTSKTSGGSTNGKAEEGDSVLYTFSEEMSPSSIMSGWSGATTNVVVRFNNLADDTVTVFDPTNTTQLNLGSVDLHRNNYVSANVTFGASGTPSTMTLNGSGVTVVLGTVSDAGSVGTVTANDTMRWTPSASATDIAGNAMTTTVRLETGTGDYEFSSVTAAAAITYPTSSTFSASSFNDGCGTTDMGDICGTAAFPRADPLVQVSVRQMGSLLYWDGTGFNSFSEVLLTATGTTSWSYSFAGSNFTADGDYTVRVLSSDSGATTATASSTFTMETVPPATAVTFPVADARYATNSWDNGCTSMICGTASDASGISNVKVSVRQLSSGNYWNGTGFSSSTEVLNTATGTTSWTYALAGTAFPTEGSYTVRAVATDGAGNTGSSSVTFLIDRTAPTIAVTFPVSGASYSPTSFDAACSTAPGDLCGTADDAGGFGAIYLSLQQVGGNYWDGSSFASTSAVYLQATGTTSWSYPLAAANFPSTGDYTLVAIPLDAAGNYAFTISTFTFDGVTPTVSSINRSSATPTNASSVSWDVTFSEAVTGVDAADFELASTGLGGTPAITNVSGSGTSYTVTASAGSGNGTLGLNLTTTATVSDLAGNPMGSSGFTGQVYTFDRDLPSSTLTHPAIDGAYYNASGWTNGGCSAGTGRICGTATDPTNAVTSVEVSIQKDGGANSYWDGSAFTAPQTFVPATGTTSWALALASSKLLNGSTYLITVRTTDAAGNVDSSTTRSFTYDTAVPFVSSITGPAATAATTIDYTVTFSESVAPVIAGDFSLTTTGVVGASITGISGSGSTRTVTVNTGIGTGTIRVNLADANDTILDLAGNINSPRTFTTGTIVAVDRTAPPAPAITYPSTTYTGPTAWLASCSTPAVDDFCGTATDTGGAGVGTVEVSIQQGIAGNYWNGTSFSSIVPVYNLAGGTDTWTYAIANGAFTNNVQYTIVARTTDAVGNAGLTTASWTFTWDGTAPTATITVPAYSIMGPVRYESGCGTPTTGDMCGTAADGLSGVSSVQISIKNNTTNTYWDGGGWGSAGGPEDWRTATGTTSWTFAIDESKFINASSYTVRVRSIDAGANTSTIQTFTYTWDDVIPGGSTVATNNAGATDGKAEAGDTITFTYTETMDPTSIRSTWDGSLTTITVRLNNDDGVLNRDYVTIWGATNSTQFEIGRLNLNRTDYVTGAVGTYRINFTNSTIVQNGAVITVTLGTPDDISRLGTAGGNAAAPWTPSAVAYDMAGNASTTTNRSTPSEKAF